MASFALYIDGVFQRIDRREERPPNIEHKKVAWYPVFNEFGDEPFTGIVKDRHIIRTIDPATLPPPVPEWISDRQFFQQLAIIKLISEAEAEDAVASGVIPSSLAELVELLPEQARHPTRMLLKGATVFQRQHEMTDTIAWLYGLDGAAVDAIFRAAAEL